MRLITTLTHPSLTSLEGRIFHRLAARGILLDGEDILLLYTKRYNDFSLPGGGVDSHEDLLAGLHRELTEETGAQNIKVLQHFGHIIEHRPAYKRDQHDVITMTSHLYHCQADRELGVAKMEGYERANGMEAKWINIYEAHDHNQKVIKAQEKSMGLSIQRETLILDLIIKEIVD
jgi:ADP-ribose pyrophosphatase YjhB (NUDIX family)